MSSCTDHNPTITDTSVLSNRNHPRDSGPMNIQEMITKRYNLDELNQRIEALPNNLQALARKYFFGPAPTMTPQERAAMDANFSRVFSRVFRSPEADRAISHSAAAASIDEAELEQLR